MENKGVIYILTNPSFPEYVKIGYADDVKKRLQQLNRSECIPFAFRIYATYGVADRLSDIQIHSIIDSLNPNLRAIENFEGKKRVREFYAMTAEDAYKLLEGIAKINGMTSNLKKYSMTQKDKVAEETAEEIKEEKHERQSPFAFSKCGIKFGEIIEFYADSNIKCVVVDDKNVEYDGQIYSLSALAAKLAKSKWPVAGPRYFKYNGEGLNTIRRRFEEK